MGGAVHRSLFVELVVRYPTIRAFLGRSGRKGQDPAGERQMMP